MVTKERPRFLIVSVQDFRSKRKVNVHFICRELAKKGNMKFFSLGFSFLSNLKGRDPRIGLRVPWNEVQTFESVQCYLWRSAFHPFNLKLKLFSWLHELPFSLYERMLPKRFLDWVRDSDIVLVEAGIGVVVLDLVKKVNPSAKLIYMASDDLRTINASPALIERLRRSASDIDLISAPSQLLLDELPLGPKRVLSRHGIDGDIAKFADPSPYEGGVNAVSVGTMLFDPNFFHIACVEFPQINFHVIGSGYPPDKLPKSVKYYEEMKFEDTIKYIKHADFGVAPYKNANVPTYLADTSMKLLQFGYFQIYSVCPNFAVGNNADCRIGYEPGDKKSIIAAIKQALIAGSPAPKAYLSWEQIVEDILNAL